MKFSLEKKKETIFDRYTLYITYTDMTPSRTHTHTHTGETADRRTDCTPTLAYILAREKKRKEKKKKKEKNLLTKRGYT